MGMPASGSIVAFIEDRRTSNTPISNPLAEALLTVAIESRWQFSRLQCVFISVVRGSNNLKHCFETSLCGIVDQQVFVDNATDLCGWIGASNSIFVLDAEPPQSDKHRPHSTLQIGAESLMLSKAIGTVGNGFRKPLNFINKSNPQRSLDKLDWERLHQSTPGSMNNEAPLASIPFVEAVGILERAFEAKATNPCSTLDEKTHVRRAG